MTAIQIILLAVVTLVAAVGITATLRGIVRRRELAVWLAVCMFASVAIIWPDATTRISKLIGVGRGKDLLLYTSVIVMLIGFLMIYGRVRKLRREITLLTRALAIRDAVINDPKITSDTDPAE